MPSTQVLTPNAYRAAAWMLDCEVAAIMAVAEVESGEGGAFLPTGEPVILFEPHYFSRLTGRKFDKSHPSLSYQSWRPGAYGKASAQHAKLAAAALLDRSAALKSCSWGLFQIMGENHRLAGFDSVQAMVTAAYKDADSHLRMFVNFILANTRLQDALRTQDWARFASNYNGPKYAVNKYDTRMAEAYQRARKAGL